MVLLKLACQHPQMSLGSKHPQGADNVLKPALECSVSFINPKGATRALRGLLRPSFTWRAIMTLKDTWDVTAEQQSLIDVIDGLWASNFISDAMRDTYVDSVRDGYQAGYEKQFRAIDAIIKTMPVTYQQDGKADESIVYLHYSLGGANWYITEKDKTGTGTVQAFGLADLFQDGGELGYISIEELTSDEIGAELDLNWIPKTLREAKDKQAGNMNTSNANDTAAADDALLAELGMGSDASSGMLEQILPLSEFIDQFGGGLLDAVNAQTLRSTPVRSQV